MLNNVNAKENYIVVLVNNIPITKIDVIERAKLISYSIHQNVEFKNLNKFYDQSIRSLIQDNIKKYEGFKYNANILKSVTNKAYELTLSEYQNSEKKLNQFTNKLSISKSSILNRYEAELIWGIVLKNKFKKQSISIDKEITKIIRLRELEKNKDKYDLAEIVIPKKNNLDLFNRIMTALKQGADFSNIAKQVSMNSSSRLGGKIGWKTYKDLPYDMTKNNLEINEGDLFNFTTKDTINIIKILVKRNKGKASYIENKVLLAEINFQINFGNKNKIYQKIKNKLSVLLKDKKSCDVLKIINHEKNEHLKLRVIESRIVDLDISLQKNIKNLQLFKVIGPIYKGNSGYLFVYCDIKDIKLRDIKPNLIKKKILDKRLAIFNARVLKKLTQNAVIKTIRNIN
ncbi:peptidylprolyl isomerase [Pseudomonadota bacterium]|nr:peptidylprolyl isomerase [Pseudomonadota bacterium]